MSANTSARRASEEPEIRADYFQIKLPEPGTNCDQDSEFCILEINGEQRTLRFHDYHEIYETPGLYERLFYEVLECNSPRVVCELLGKQLERAGVAAGALRVLDLGAGNGIVAEELRTIGVPYVVGADIIPEAGEAAKRDRPDAYVDYHVVDIAKLSAEEHDELSAHRLNGLTCVAALGFGDIPPEAFGAAFNLVSDSGWIAFTLKERFLSEHDPSGFGQLMKHCADEGILDVHSSQRYQHRLNVGGEPIHYTAMVATKKGDIPAEFFS